MSAKTDKTIYRLRVALATGVPVIVIRTFDQPNMVERIETLLREVTQKGDLEETPEMRRIGWRWDPVNGASPCPGKRPNGFAWGVDPLEVLAPTGMVEKLSELPDNGVVIAISGTRCAEDPIFCTGLTVLRDRLKSRRQHVILLGPMFRPAAELGFDAYVIEDEPPDTATRRDIATQLLSSALDAPPGEKIIDACDTYTRGLSRFACEQTIALALRSGGIDVEELANVWRNTIDSLPGLKVLKDLPRKDQIAGLATIRNYLQQIAAGRQKPEVVVFVDEIEKAVSGASGASQDSSGASQVVLGAMLKHMEDSACDGILLIGPPGTGKSLVAKIAGSILEVPTIRFDPGGIKGGLVGQTEENASITFPALAALGGRQLWIATCNSIGSMPPEFLRRFSSGIYFVDLPDNEELDAIWRVHTEGAGLAAYRYENDKDWTGADVRNVVNRAWRLDVPVAEVAANHVPSTLAAKAMINQLRQAAAGTYFSASKPGAYQMPQSEYGRKINAL